MDELTNEFNINETCFYLEINKNSIAIRKIDIKKMEYQGSRVNQSAAILYKGIRSGYCEPVYEDIPEMFVFKTSEDARKYLNETIVRIVE